MRPKIPEMTNPKTPSSGISKMRGGILAITSSDELMDNVAIMIAKTNRLLALLMVI